MKIDEWVAALKNKHKSCRALMDLARQVFQGAEISRKEHLENGKFGWIWLFIMGSGGKKGVMEIFSETTLNWPIPPRDMTRKTSYPDRLKESIIYLESVFLCISYLKKVLETWYHSLGHCEKSREDDSTHAAKKMLPKWIDGIDIFLKCIPQAFRNNMPCNR